MPYYVLIALAAAQWLWARRQSADSRLLKWLPAALLLAMLAQLGVFAIEAHLRRRLGAQDEMLRAMDAPLHRQEISDELLAALGQPANRPVTLLFEEVQIRYWLDDRFVVRSSDGRVDPELLKYVHGHAIDHLGYIKGRDIDFIMETPDYAAGADQFSLKDLSKLKPGDILERDGVRFSLVCVDGKPLIYRVTRKPIYRVERLAPSSSEFWRSFDRPRPAGRAPQSANAYGFCWSRARFSPLGIRSDGTFLPHRAK